MKAPRNRGLIPNPNKETVAEMKAEDAENENTEADEEGDENDEDDEVEYEQSDVSE